MYRLSNITKILLLEQDSKITDLRKSIIDRKPISIQYTGPPDEVMTGPRYDIEPIVMGTHAKTGNLVIWAYVFRGVSKKGIPGWKMFRVDRIQSIDKSGFDKDSFKLSDLPGYQRGKAPSAMKSLERVDIFSPYWFEDYKRYEKKPYQPAPPVAEPAPPIAEPTPPEGEIPPEDEVPTITSPDLSQHRLDTLAFNDLKTKIRDVNGQQTISNQDYSSALEDLYNKKEGEWKNYQRLVAGNARAGEGTRRRFQTASKQEIDNLLRANNITISDEQQNQEPPENNQNNLAEAQKRFKELIFS